MGTKSFELLAPQMLWFGLPILALLLLVLLRRKRGIVVMLLRMLTLGLILLALAQPAEVNRSSSEQLSAIFDISASISESGRKALAERLLPFLENGRNISISAFGRNTSPRPELLQRNADVDDVLNALSRLEGEIHTGESNLSNAILQAVTSADSSSVLLLSDGFETLGNARENARLAGGHGVRIYPLVPDEDAFRLGELSISTLNVPLTVQAGEVAPIRVSVKNNTDAKQSGQLEIWLENKKLYSANISVPAEEERLITLKSPALEGGLKRVRAVLSGGSSKSENDPQSEKHGWISVKNKQKILLLNGSKDDARVIAELLQLSGYAMESIICDGNTPLPKSFESYSAIIVNNAAKRQLLGGSPNFLQNIKTFVSDGGGLLLIGGDRSFGLGDYIDTPLEEASPVKFVPPQTTKRRLNTAVILIIDKSSSMQQDGKMDQARAAALISVQAMKDDDYIGVTAFDTNPFVVIEADLVANVRPHAERRLRNLTALGRTILLPALTSVRREIQRLPASRKHIIVLTDGRVDDESSIFFNEVDSMRAGGITLSTIAVGPDADAAFLRSLSSRGGGAFYQTLDARRLPEYFVQDIKVAAGEKTMKEQSEYTVVEGPSGMSTVDVGPPPPLLGFVETLPKKNSNLELITRKDDKVFPILSSWTFGSGKAVAFTSDANGRWSRPWLRWEEFSKFWAQTVESIKNRSGQKGSDLDYDLRYSVDGKLLTLDLAVFDEKLATSAAPRIQATVFEPGGETKQVLFQQSQKGRFAALLGNGRPGDYKIEVSYGNTKLPPAAITLPGDLFGEVQGHGINVQTLSDIAQLSGGSMNPDPRQITSKPRVSEDKTYLYVPLVILAFFLLLLEAFVRELGFGALSRKQESGAAGNVRPIGTYQKKRTTSEKRAA